MTIDYITTAKLLRERLAAEDGMVVLVGAALEEDGALALHNPRAIILMPETAAALRAQIIGDLDRQIVSLSQTANTEPA